MTVGRLLPHSLETLAYIYAVVPPAEPSLKHLSFRIAARETVNARAVVSAAHVVPWTYVYTLAQTCIIRVMQTSQSSRNKTCAKSCARARESLTFRSARSDVA